MTNRKELIVVLGMHRSGTSAITRGLQVLGVSLGERLMPAIENINARGFWEDIDLNSLNIEMLQAIGSDWFYLAPINADNVNKLHKDGYFLRAVELLQEKVCDVPIFGFKDPRMAKLLPFWKEVFNHCQLNVKYVLTIRHPLSVVRSLAKRDGFVEEHSYLLWLGHTLESLIGSIGKPRVLVDYDCMMQSPDAELMRVARALNLEIDNEELHNYETKFLDESLRHTKYDSSDLLSDIACPAIVQEVYSTLLDVMSDSVSINDNKLSARISCWVAEFEQLKSALVLADKLLSQKASVSRDISERDGRIASLNEAVTERDRQIASLNETVTERDSQIAALYSSTSWRLTRPLRFIMHLIRATQTLKKTVSYYGSPIVVLKKVVRIFRNEGVLGVLSRANVLSEVMRTSILRDAGNMREGLRWLIPPVDNDFLPKVSVIVPNYNHAPYLKKRLDSIYGQTYRNLEVILLDDCSTDESQNILCEYASRYKEITTVVFNSINSGGVFNQWHKGISLAHGDLIWIAESDDYCDVTHLSELVRFFKNEAVMLSFCRSDFVRGDECTKIWTSEEFLADTKLDIWGNEFIRSAHWVVNNAWGMKNIIPNASSAIFRHPGPMSVMDDKSWRKMRLCGDWIFYLHLIRGGLIAYSPRTTNYYRQHDNGTSINIQKENTYYREHERVAVELLELYKIDPSILDRQRQSLYLHWCVSRGFSAKREFEALYDLARAHSVAKPRTPNILMVGFALIAGGGETFPIMMANLLRKRGAGVSFLNCRNAQTDLGVRGMLNYGIPLFELDGMHRVEALCYDLGVEIIHSHHAWVDITLAQCLMYVPQIKQVITMHGMYEMMSSDTISNIISLMERRISRIIFTAEKNLTPFSKEFQERKKFTRINNALEIEEIHPVERSTLGIGEGDFVLCLVSRAIPEKGWMEAIQAVELARLHCPRKICLLLIGEGEEFDRLKHKYASELTQFLGFRSNIRDYFAMADMGILPSRFKGESYPLVLIDCLLAGKPMVASRVGAIHEMLSADGSLAGELFELQNFSIPVENLANLIARLASDSTYYQILKERVPSAAKKFDPSIMMEKYEDIYRSVLIAE